MGVFLDLGIGAQNYFFTLILNNGAIHKAFIKSFIAVSPFDLRHVPYRKITTIKTIPKRTTSIMFIRH